MLEIIKRRRSVRNYLAEQIKEEELKAILEAAYIVPAAITVSHGILQLFKIKCL